MLRLSDFAGRVLREDDLDDLGRPTGEVIEEAIDAGRTDEAKSLAPYLRNRVSIPYVALLYASTTEERFENRDGTPSHRGELKGFAKALLQEKILFDVISEADLLAGIDQYRTLILPNASCLSAAGKAAVRAFAASGGGVIGSYETGLYDSSGRRDDADDFSALFGVGYTGDMLPFELDIYMRVEESHALPTAIPANKRLPTVGMQVCVEADAAKPVAHIHGASEVHYVPLSDELGPPVVPTHAAEGGRRVLFTPPIGVRYLEFGIRDFRRLIADALLWTARERPPARVSNAGDALALTAFKQGARTLIHLVNSIRDEIRQPINETIPSFNVEVEVDLAGPATSVSAFGDQTEVDWEADGARVRVKVAGVRYHVLLVID